MFRKDTLDVSSVKMATVCLSIIFIHFNGYVILGLDTQDSGIQILCRTKFRLWGLFCWARNEAPGFREYVHLTWICRLRKSITSLPGFVWRRTTLAGKMVFCPPDCVRRQSDHGYGKCWHLSDEQSWSRIHNRHYILSGTEAEVEAEIFPLSRRRNCGRAKFSASLVLLLS